MADSSFIPISNPIGNVGLEQVQRRWLLFLAASLIGAYAAFWIARSFYNIYFHSLAKFPGRRRAAISTQWLYEQQKTGIPEAIFEDLHQHYNTTALRIGPNELHLTDIDLYKTIYSQIKPFPKEPRFYEAFNIPTTLTAEIVPSLHKERRKMLNPLFSHQGVTQLEPMITATIKEFMSKVRKLAKRGSINVYDAYRCLTVDIISQFAFGRSTNLLNESEGSFSTHFLKTIDKLGPQLWEQLYGNILPFLAKAIPLHIIARVNKEVKPVLDMHNFARESVENYKTKDTKPSHPVIFDYLKSIPNWQQAIEAVEIILAGSDTTAFTLCTASYHICRNKAIKSRLVRELKEAIPDQQQIPSLLELERIPYLYACVKEALRVAMPVPGRLPRIVPKTEKPFTIEGKVVPPGTVVGISAYTMNRSTEVWGSDAHEFNPDRWLEDGKRLNDRLCTFSKGTRQCIGMNVAHAEITLVLARIFRDFDIEVKTPQLKVKDYFASGLEGHELILRFKELGPENER